jgi:hypothetical protein
MKQKQRIDRAIDLVMQTPTRWFDHTNGRPVLKLLALVWFIALMFPCLFITALLICINLPFVIWDEMK